MELPASELYDYLVSKGILGLYHANTVSTAKTFLQRGHILSRQYVEENDLFQTPQKSDEKDKRFNLWNYIFFDALNIGTYFSTYNKYGPILFRYSLELLKDVENETIRITRSNPIHWKPNKNDNEKYFTDISEFKSMFLKGDKSADSGYHIIFTNRNGKIPFNYLNAIQIDDPKIEISDREGNKEQIINKILDYYSPDFLSNSISKEMIYTRSETFLSLQYKFLKTFNINEFKRLFSRIETIKNE